MAAAGVTAAFCDNLQQELENEQARLDDLNNSWPRLVTAWDDLIATACARRNESSRGCAQAHAEKNEKQQRQKEQAQERITTIHETLSMCNTLNSGGRHQLRGQ